MDNWREDSNKEGNHRERLSKEVRVSALKNRESQVNTQERTQPRKWFMSIQTDLNFAIMADSKEDTRKHQQPRKPQGKFEQKILEWCPQGTEIPPSTHMGGYNPGF